MASAKLLSLTCILLLSGLVVSGEIKGTTAACDVQCIQGGHITCDNYPGKELEGCVCECAPKDGVNCVLHLEHGPSSNCPAQVQRLD
ncbi:hypothetical protein PR202_ga13352 [Eleusine coracana subsp. coracana]|uniref:Uncharacterized protein n=1 Tax=Eleusine coracana subsp. coracana TaxID=191504 RepID=A0AAV5CEL0_ELECO|nr:hypothetical protein QOZ80_3AG0217450 [Eleusine coracana subsp. coracana]GJM96512.1 hypothetical protein PR202_ga13352 [Eleusine coracana subsp. coracana]